LSSDCYYIIIIIIIVIIIFIRRTHSMVWIGFGLDDCRVRVSFSTAFRRVPVPCRFSRGSLIPRRKTAEKWC
jgi:hypothetical protein